TGKILERFQVAIELVLLGLDIALHRGIGSGVHTSTAGTHGAGEAGQVQLCRWRSLKYYSRLDIEPEMSAAAWKRISDAEKDQRRGFPEGSLCRNLRSDSSGC